MQTKRNSPSSQTLQDFSFNLILEKPWTQSLLQWSCSTLPNSVVGSLLPDQSLTWWQLMENLVQDLVSRTISKVKIYLFYLQGTIPAVQGEDWEAARAPVVPIPGIPPAPALPVSSGAPRGPGGVMLEFRFLNK